MMQNKIQSIFTFSGKRPSDYHTYAYFKQTLHIVDPTILSQTLREVFSNQLSDDDYLPTFQVLCSQVERYFHQFEECKYSIHREQKQQSYNRGYNQKMEYLSRQLEQLEEQWKLNYYVIKKSITNDLKVRMKAQQNDIMIENLFKYLTQQVVDEINRGFSLPISSSDSSNDEDSEFDPPQKKRKTANEIFESNNISIRYILEKLELHPLCQLYLDIVRFICRPSDKLASQYKLVPITIPDGIEEHGSLLDFLPSLQTFQQNYSRLLHFLSITSSDFLYVCMSLENPFVTLPMTFATILMNIYYSFQQLGDQKQKIFNTDVFHSLTKTINHQCKRELLVLNHMCIKIPDLPKTLIFPFIEELIFSNVNTWNERKEIIVTMLLYMMSECDGILKVILPDFLELSKNHQIEFLEFFNLLPYSNIDRHGLGAILEIISEHLQQMKDFSFEYLVTLKRWIEDDSIPQNLRDKCHTILNYTVSILQEDFIVYSCKLQEYNYSLDTFHQTSPPFVYRLNSLTFLNSLHSKTEEIIGFALESSKMKESVWFFLIELLGLSGGETMASNILLHLLTNYYFSTSSKDRNGNATVLFLKLYDSFSKNYAIFDEPFIEKVLWIVSNTNNSEKTCTIISNLCLWVNLLKDVADQEVHYKPVIFYNFIIRWQLLYPFLFRNGSNVQDLPLRLLESFISILKSSSKIEDTTTPATYTAVITIPELIANQFSQALLAYYFFLLKPTFTTKHQRRHQLRSKQRLSHDLIPTIILEPETDVASTLYYYYFVLIVMAGRTDIIEKCRNVIKEIISVMCSRFEQVACSTFDFALDLIFCNHMESRLHATNVFTSSQVHEQINYPLLYQKDALSIINYFFPEETSVFSKVLSNDDIKPEDKSTIIKLLFKNVEDESMIELTHISEITPITSTSDHQSLVTQLIQPNHKMSKTKTVLEDKLTIRTKGVVFVNPSNVHKKLKNQSFTLKKDTYYFDKHNEEVVKLNKSHILSLFSKCLFSQTEEHNISCTLQLGKQLMKRLKLQNPIQTITQLLESLPKKPMTEREIVIDKMFHKFPIIYSLIDFISLAYPRKFIEIENMETTLISLFANAIGEWNLRVLSNNKGFGSSENDKHLIMKTIQITNVLIRAELVIEPMDLVTEIIPHVSPKEAVEMLMDVFRCMGRLKAMSTAAATTGNVSSTTPPTTTTPTSSADSISSTTPPTSSGSEEFDIEPYMASIKNALRNHLDQFAPIYARFTSASKSASANNQPSSQQ
ncbi:hypothetical protein C9374_002325 [Naegleria lovaniensis]|uniref:Uncharacterized protein n=1 Tax=Naegleria lovaniensis TaxID=51637 RepID=A0AA88GQL4_NAELO|nr:uncharacterized protein C9374_002325 [Naegleria lovaniensis]KAG2386581.1 hypothetical protein C9374_002325 [Naegleria lovaniensis]